MWSVEATPEYIFSISEYCTRLGVATGVQRGKRCYDASISQEEAIEDFSLSRAIP